MRRNRLPGMKEAREQGKRPNGARSEPELRFAGVEFKPAPDAQDRLRRLFTILAAHFADKDAMDEKQVNFDDGQPADEDDRGAE